MQEVQSGERQEVAKNSDKNLWTLIAVMAPLEGALRARFGQKKICRLKSVEGHLNGKNEV